MHVAQAKTQSFAVRQLAIAILVNSCATQIVYLSDDPRPIA